LLLLAVIAVGCGSSRLTELTGPKWQEATSASGNYVAEFPGPPKTETKPIPGSDLSIQMVTFEAGGDAFTLTETALNGIAPYPLDEAVDGAIENSRLGQEPDWGTVTATERSRTTGDIEGLETREYRYDLVGEDDKMMIGGVIFYDGDIIVHAMTVTDSESDAEAVDRFLSSLRFANQAG
jgi:hypothetical protein